MKRDEESGGMWCVVMFDLPVQTKAQRRAATQFRHLLLDMGYLMVQFSVYARYAPTQSGNRTTVKEVLANIPEHGKVRILHVSDNQWSKAVHFCNGTEEDNDEMPELLLLF
ncbi:CRISPR-associated endonuclease Cas2 [Bifidobacterium dolichotidis]|uniref:CRISPR-associated endoribonuclease Cas2 n=1 Tax=Bifidobacterium dolichotidis TaxID=2306976 RepID=A0A430FRW6_9BIFI|nr:CRISPR-associated endonuclease Cas2 [Bifidobacterium dolichotidis]RSX55614.1 CRISPR-associated endonuclease Cas2 [Bifidobacterium dolichotidis]